MPEQTTATFSRLEPVGAQWRSDGLLGDFLGGFLGEDPGTAAATRSAVFAPASKPTRHRKRAPARTAMKQLSRSSS